MAKRKGKSVSFDAMVKFFLQYHNIPTKKDIDRILDRLDRLEGTLRRIDGQASVRGAGTADRRSRAKGETTATDAVMDVIRQADREIGFAEIQKRTGFSDKKLRNIIYRLSKVGRIQRVRRGIYTCTD